MVSPRVDMLINGDEEALKLWNEWGSDALSVNEAVKQDEETARKVKETEILALMDAQPPIAVLTYESEEDLFRALVKAMGTMAQNRTRPTALLGTLSEGEDAPYKDNLASWGVSFHNVPGIDPGHFWLFNSQYELYSPRYGQVYNISGSVVEIKKKEKAK